jgi:hypothetical protein
MTTTDIAAPGARVVPWEPIDLLAPDVTVDHEPIPCENGCGQAAAVALTRRDQHGTISWTVAVCLGCSAPWEARQPTQRLRLVVPGPPEIKPS